jgi:hypothetical protein
MKETIVMIVVFIAICAAIGACCAAWDCKICNDKTEGIGFDNTWSIFGGCRISVNGTWIPLDNYRLFGED